MHLNWVIIFSLLALPVLSCNENTSVTSPGTSIPENSVTEKYQNPVFEPVLADPSVVRGDDGWFYAYGTADDWGDGNGYRLVPIIRSSDLVHWSYVNDAFTKMPDWKKSGGIWAPDVVKVGNNYYLYYAYSTWGDSNPGIGLAISASPKGPFVDKGKLFDSQDADVPNSIDPFYFEDQGRKYLFWGSFSNAETQGTYGVELSPDGKSVPDLNKKFKIAAGDFEAVMIVKKTGMYYFFGSKGGCCDGAESSYQVRVGRSERLEGPYKDYNGKLLTNRGSGRSFIYGSATYAGPGHNARIITDDNGIDWLLYHAILRSNPYVPTGANRRVLMLDRLSWKDGWPVVEGNIPGEKKQDAPYFK